MSGWRVLVTDDDVAHRTVLCQYLRLSGYEVVECGDGEEALDRIRQVVPDLVVLDVDMPRLDGFSTLERIRKFPQFESTPVLFLTGMDRRSARVRGLELGADDYISKPFDRAELLARIRGALRRHVRTRAASGALTGDIGQLGLDALLQTLDLGRRSARMVLEEVGGELVLDEGVLIDCRYGRFTGLAALVRLLWIASGRFRLDFVDPSSRTSTTESVPVRLQEAFMVAATEIDEARMELGGNAEDLRVELGDGDIDPGVERLRPLFPLKVRDLLLLMERALPDNARWISAALGDGRLRPETP